MDDLVFPTTDRAVVVQALVALTLYGIAAFAVRRNRELLLFVAGLAALTFGFMGLRTLH